MSKDILTLMNAVYYRKYWRHYVAYHFRKYKRGKVAARKRPSPRKEGLVIGPSITITELASVTSTQTRLF